MLLFWQNMASIKQWNPVHGIATGVAGDYKVPAPDLFCALVLRAAIRSVLENMCSRASKK